MNDKNVKTNTKARTALIVVIGLAVFITFVALIVLFRSNLRDIISGGTEVTYEGSYDVIEASTNPLVTAGVQEISGRPEVNSTDPTLGTTSPKIKIIWFGSFDSGYTAVAQPILEEIMTKYSNQIQLIWKDYYSQNDSMAQLGAQAARCAQQQNKFWEMHKEIFQTQGGYYKDDILDLADKIGLDSEKFTSCLDNQEVIGLINQNISEGISLNLPGAPIFFVSDAQPLVGIVTRMEFEALIEQELEKVQ